MGNLFIKIRKKLFRILYRGIGIHLPSSVNSKVSQKIRYWMASRFVESCGSNVNFEHGAQIDSDLRIGSNSGVGINCVTVSMTIGDNVMMGPECVFLPHNHHPEQKNILQKVGPLLFDLPMLYTYLSRSLLCLPEYQLR